jgi:hypothetical protein
LQVRLARTCLSEAGQVSLLHFIEPAHRTRLMNSQNHPNTPMSGGPKGALASRGADSAARALKRLLEAVRR